MKKITKFLQNLVTCIISIVITLVSFTAKIFNYFPKINQNVLLGLGCASFIVGALSFAFFLIKFIKKDTKSVSEEKQEKKEKLDLKKRHVLSTWNGQKYDHHYFIEKGEAVPCDKEGNDLPIIYEKESKTAEDKNETSNAVTVKKGEIVVAVPIVSQISVPATFWSSMTEEERNQMKEKAEKTKLWCEMNNEEKKEFLKWRHKVSEIEWQAFRHFMTPEQKDDVRKRKEKIINEREKKKFQQQQNELEKTNEQLQANLSKADEIAQQTEQTEKEKAAATLAQITSKTTQDGTQTYIVKTAVLEALHQAGIDTKGKVRSSSGWKWIAAAVAAILIFAIVGIGVWIYWLNIKSSHDAKLAKQTSVDSGTKSQNVTVAVNTDPKQIDSILKANAPLLAKYIADSLRKGDSINGASNLKSDSTISAQADPVKDSTNKQTVQTVGSEEQKKNEITKLLQAPGVRKRKKNSSDVWGQYNNSTTSVSSGGWGNYKD